MQKAKIETEGTPDQRNVEVVNNGEAVRPGVVGAEKPSPAEVIKEVFNEMLATYVEESPEANMVKTMIERLGLSMKIVERAAISLAASVRSYQKDHLEIGMEKLGIEIKGRDKKGELWDRGRDLFLLTEYGHLGDGSLAERVVLELADKLGFLPESTNYGRIWEFMDDLQRKDSPVASEVSGQVTGERAPFLGYPGARAELRVQQSRKPELEGLELNVLYGSGEVKAIRLFGDTRFLARSAEAFNEFFDEEKE